MKLKVSTVLISSVFSAYTSRVGAVENLCQAKKPLPSKLEKFDPKFHVFFARCHPTLPFAFSNQINMSKPSPYDIEPIALNMKTGQIQKLNLPNGKSAEDLVPSPDGKFLYADITEDIKKFEKSLGIYGIEKSGKLKLLGKIPVGPDYGYPSPAVRNGENLILARDGKNPALNKIIQTQDSFKMTDRIELCPGTNMSLNTHIDRPYISPDAEYMAVAANNQMQIIKLRWDQISADKKNIPCEVVRKLPNQISKISFSPDNKKIVFHASQLNFLGKGAKSDDYNPQSYMMDLETGKVIALTDENSGYNSEFPYFCGANGILIRESKDDGIKSKSLFKIVPIPDTNTEIVKNGCNLNSQPNYQKSAKMWEEICATISPELHQVALKVDVNPTNCKKLLELWKSKASSSSIKSSDIKAACEE